MSHVVRPRCLTAPPGVRQRGARIALSRRVRVPPMSRPPIGPRLALEQGIGLEPRNVGRREACGPILLRGSGTLSRFSTRARTVHGVSSGSKMLKGKLGAGREGPAPQARHRGAPAQHTALSNARARRKDPRARGARRRVCGTESALGVREPHSPAPAWREARLRTPPATAAALFGPPSEPGLGVGTARATARGGVRRVPQPRRNAGGSVPRATCLVLLRGTDLRRIAIDRHAPRRYHPGPW